MVNLKTTYGSILFLVDSGAEISVIKLNHLNDDTMVKKEKIIITGVGKGSIESLGMCKEKVLIDDSIFSHTFHIVPNDFPITMDGILGYDFLVS